MQQVNKAGDFRIGPPFTQDPQKTAGLFLFSAGLSVLLNLAFHCPAGAGNGLVIYNHQPKPKF